MSNTEVVYELAYVLRVGESDSALKAVLQKNGATIVKEQPVAQIQLAYPIKKQEVAGFGFLHLTVSDSKAVQAISDALQLTDSVLRFIVVKVPSTAKAKKSVARRERVEAGINVPADKKAGASASTARIDTLSNESLSKTLEDILK
jgi:ribosomal protein S6